MAKAMNLLMPVLQFFDNTGLPLSGGKLYFYVSGSTTLKNTYTDSTKNTANANPVILDSAGRPDNSGTPVNIFLDGTYKLVVANSSDVAIRTMDPINTLGQLITTRSTSSDGTVTESDRDKVILVDASSANVTLTIAAVASLGDGFQFTVKKMDNSANTVTLDANSSELIDGATTRVISNQYDSLQLTCDGTQWVTNTDSTFPNGITATDGTFSDDVYIGDQLTVIGNTALSDTVTLGEAINEKLGTTIASASSIDLGAATGNYVSISGTTTITALGTVQAGTRRIVTFTGILTLTHNGTSLILPNNGSDITTAAGDSATFVSLGSGNWICVDYQKANGRAVSVPTAVTSVVTQVFTGSGTYTPTAGMAYAIIEAIGGGGGSGGFAGTGSNSGATGGGGAGNYIKCLLTAAQVGASAVVTIGAAGTAGASGNNAGGAGGDTTVAATVGTITAKGGSASAGATTSASAAANAGGAGGVAGTPQGTTILNIAGQKGNYGYSNGATPIGFGGAGASSPLGIGGPMSPQPISAGQTGTGYGAGGGGCCGTNTSAAGAAGTAGIVIITEYIVT